LSSSAGKLAVPAAAVLATLALPAWHAAAAPKGTSARTGQGERDRVLAQQSAAVVALAVRAQAAA